MSEQARFSYMQARLQSRHGERVDELTWRRLNSNRNAANYLQSARQTPLRRWLTGLQGTDDTHAIEQALRQQFRLHVDAVAHWVPAHWSATLQHLRCLPDLPALQHLLAGRGVATWMHDDPVLAPLVAGRPMLRRDALAAAGLAWLPVEGPREQALVHAWLAHWRTLWPRVPRFTAGLEQLTGLLLSYSQSQLKSPASSHERREALDRQLTQAFRRYRFQPAAACAHLGLVALELEHLRGALVGRLLYPDNGVDAA